MIEPASNADESGAMAMLDPMVMDIVPADGQTITVPATDRKEIFLNLAPAGDLQMLTVIMPKGYPGQRCFVGSTKGVWTCHMTADGMTVNNADIMLSPGDNAAYVCNRNLTWSRVLTS